MNPKYPIYVISKGRADLKGTSWHLTQMKVHHFVVIEQTEAAEYLEKMEASEFRSFKILPFNDLGQGSIPARNWVWNDSKEIMRSKRHWIMDDNIYGFMRLNKNCKIRVSDGAILKAAEDFVDRYENVPIAGLNYDYFCKACDPLPPFYMNTRVYSCILIENEMRLPARWRGRYNEDTDLCLRALKLGYCTILFNAFLAAKAATLTTKGGNTDNVYVDGDDRMAFAKSLQEQHPDVVEVKRKFGRWHHQVDYKPFKRNELKRIASYRVPEGVNNYGMKLKEIS